MSEKCEFKRRPPRFIVLSFLMSLIGVVFLSACGDTSATTNPTTTLAATTAAAGTSATATTASVTTSAAATNSTSTTTGAATTGAATTGAAITAATTGAATTSSVTTAAGTGTVAATTTATSTTTSADTTPKVVDAATAFIATLDNTQKTAGLFDFSDTAQKARWSNFPNGAFQRAGLMWGDLSDTQKTAWLKLMSTTLSQRGYQRVLEEWNADDALAATDGGGGGANFGTQYYWLAIIGTPSTTTPWQWQFGGHHITVNATVAKTNITLTPSFIGDQPASYKDSSGTTIVPLGDIETTALSLVNSLDATQKPKAVLGTSVIDLVLGPGQDGKKIASEGLKVSDMTAEQQNMLMTLMGYYANLLNDEDAAVRMADLKSHLADTYFAWYGPTTTADTGYFRITGPTVVIEYSPQLSGGGGPGGRGAAAATATPASTTAAGANHIHGIYRDPTNDYGAVIATQ